MFDKFKQIQQLRELQKQIAQKTVTEESGGVKVVVSGNMEIVELAISPELQSSEAGEQVKQATNAALKKMQKEIASFMQGSRIGF